MPSGRTNYFPWKSAWPRSLDPTIFGIRLNIFPKLLELETSNLVGGFVLGMPSRRINNFPESWRGLGHVTTTIFGSTVGYPSDSLAFCVHMLWCAVQHLSKICYESIMNFELLPLIAEQLWHVHWILNCKIFVSKGDIFGTVLLQIHSKHCQQKFGLIDVFFILLLQNQQGCIFCPQLMYDVCWCMYIWKNECLCVWMCLCMCG